ncbi:MAG: penicillin acylase family protein, partial [candidate division KSB1 bacterium]
MTEHTSIFQNERVVIARDAFGVPHVQAQREADLYWGLGYCHALDRSMQLLLMRILGKGQGCEHLDDTNEMLAIDAFFRRMNWFGGVEEEAAKLSAEAQSYCAAYCEGLNFYLSNKTPWEFKLLGYEPEPWRVGDIILLSRMVGYLTLAQSQAELERLFIEMVQAGVERERLDELFPSILDGCDEALIKQVKLQERIVPASLKWNRMLPRLLASNNWVVAGARTASGQALLANDPHLETNRLPNVWYEIVLQYGARYAIGATMPGLPSVLIGRTNDVAWGATYTFMDAVDSWIEHCKDGKYRYEDKTWRAFQTRTEVITRKKHEPSAITFYENEHGVLDGNPFDEGYYLTTRWAPARFGAKSIAQAFKMWEARNVEEGMDHLGQVEAAFNWVFADRSGNIGYQMSGLLPARRVGVSGFVPLPGWKRENDWQGFVAHADLPRCLNPEAGYFVTANNDLNDWGKTRPINNAMGSYRADRITQLLEQHEKVTREEVQRMHYDVYSLQAEAFMKILRPLLPDTPQGRILREWDLCYGPESQGAFLFEQIYRGLLHNIFGERGIGEEVASFLSKETGIFIDFYSNFDRVLLADESAWFRGARREELYRSVIAEALQTKPRAWGKVQRLP